MTYDFYFHKAIPLIICFWGQNLQKFRTFLGEDIHKLVTCRFQDFSVDKERLVRLGFMSVSQFSAAQAKQRSPDMSNLQIMDYLKSVVPKVFQVSPGNEVVLS
jgi:hypothetical protein